MLTELCLMLAAFFLGCIATELWWIAKMRRLRGLAETTAMLPASAADAGAHGFGPEAGTEESLLGLQQHLSEKTEASPAPKAAARL